jgi:hypothetical protein
MPVYIQRILGKMSDKDGSKASKVRRKKNE